MNLLQRIDLGLQDGLQTEKEVLGESGRTLKVHSADVNKINSLADEFACEMKKGTVNPKTENVLCKTTQPSEIGKTGHDSKFQGEDVPQTATHKSGSIKPMELKNEHPEEDLALYSAGMIEKFRTCPYTVEMQPETESANASNTTRRINEIVARILVTDKAYDQKKEVRILLKDNILPGTEIRISKDGEFTQVAFVTSEAESYRLLKNKKEEMQRYFDGKFKLKLKTRITLTAPKGNPSYNRNQDQTVIA